MKPGDRVQWMGIVGNVCIGVVLDPPQPRDGMTLVHADDLDFAVWVETRKLSLEQS